jgi:UDP-2,3-diacylglucosamine pyrophosphatase LpxH
MTSANLRVSNLPEYDEVHVISDLHMGGPQGFQILKETTRLANFIRWVAAQRAGERVALILNGDIIDTLAEDISGYIAIDEAVSTVQRIMGDPSFESVWDALAHFVAKEGRKLILVIGNHDIELAFPMVQRLILTRLAGENLLAHSRIEFSTMGAGYSCMVGNSRIFCTHGNEVDPWNYVRYESLSKVARRLNAGRSLTQSEWEPNAGTKMVKEIMNEVKRKYAWIDLLKPETQAAVGALLVLEPGQVSKINRIIPIIGEKHRGGTEVDQRLSAEGFQPASSSNAGAIRVDQLLGPSLAEGMKLASAAGSQSADDMMLLAEKNFNKQSAAPVPPGGTLGTGQVIWDRLTGWMTGVGQDEALRRALKDWLEGDKTFDISDRDDTYKEVTDSVGSGVDFVVTGHTHLERAIEMGGGRYYFNCGTWIRLLRLTDGMLRDTSSFKPVYDVLINGSMSAIDAARFGNDSFVMDQSSAVCVKSDRGRVVGRLTHVVGDGTGAPSEIKAFTRP